MQLKKAIVSCFLKSIAFLCGHPVKTKISQNGMILSMLSILKMLSFFLVAEALRGLIYHRSVDENFSFQFINSISSAVEEQEAFMEKLPIEI